MSKPSAFCARCGALMESVWLPCENCTKAERSKPVCDRSLTEDYRLQQVQIVVRRLK